MSAFARTVTSGAFVTRRHLLRPLGLPPSPFTLMLTQLSLLHNVLPKWVVAIALFERGTDCE